MNTRIPFALASLLVATAMAVATPSASANNLLDRMMNLGGSAGATQKACGCKGATQKCGAHQNGCGAAQKNGAAQHGKACGCGAQQKGSALQKLTAGHGKSGCGSCQKSCGSTQKSGAAQKNCGCAHNGCGLAQKGGSACQKGCGAAQKGSALSFLDSAKGKASASMNKLHCNVKNSMASMHCKMESSLHSLQCGLKAQWDRLDFGRSCCCECSKGKSAGKAMPSYTAPADSSSTAPRLTPPPAPVVAPNA